MVVYEETNLLIESVVNCHHGVQEFAQIKVFRDLL